MKNLANGEPGIITLPVNRPRIGWIDTLKGIGILTVVAGHIWPDNVARYLFLFHMPLFFFIGGFLFKQVPNGKDYLTKKAFHLLVPYVAFLFLIYVPQEIILLISGKETIAKALIRPILGGRFLIAWCAVFWYVTCFFLVQQVMNFMLNNMKKKTIDMLMIVSLLISYTIDRWFSNFQLPWNADVVFAALPIFYVGYLYKDKSIQQQLEKYKLLLFVLLIGIAVFTVYYPANTYYMKSGGYGIPFVTLFCSLVVVLCLIEVAKIVSVYPPMSKPLNQFGVASMIIMYLHQPVQIIAMEQFNIASPVWRFLIAMVVSMGGYYLLNSFEIGRALFMGSLPDFNKIFRRNKLATA